MEHIRKAIELAKELNVPGERPARIFPSERAPSISPALPVSPAPAPKPGRESKLDNANLEAKRIVAHDRMDPRSRPFEMLRTQVLQSMDENKWRVIGVTSPTPGCGKTVTALNLALSVARQPGRSALLLDLDMQKPQVANYLQLPGGPGLLSVLQGRSTLESSIIEAAVGPNRLSVLACESASSHSSEWMASSQMRTLLQSVNSYSGSGIVIIDLPPMLAGDDVLSILPQIDCVLFVAAIGTSRSNDIKECYRHLKSIPVVRVVMNKASELNTVYYYG
jgi:Mrp family chromosome partitioning ATPase